MKLLINRDFGLLTAGQVVAIIGSAVLRFALDLHVLDITGRADIFALVVALSTLPGLVCTPIGGAIADRFSKRNLMVGLDAVNAILVLAVIVLMGVGQASVPVIGIALAVLCLISSIYQPTVQASVPALVPEQRLADANGLVSGIGALSAFIAPVAGGVLYGLVGIETLLVASCVAFAAASVLEVSICIPHTKRFSEKSLVVMLVGDVRDGFRFAWRDNPIVLRIILLSCAVNMGFVPVFVIGVPYILRFTLHSGDVMYGVGLACTEIATIVGAVAAGKFMRRITLSTLHRTIWLIAVFSVPMALSMTPLVLGTGYWLPFLGFFTFEIAAVAVATAISVYIITEIQRITPSDMLGKVMSIVMAGAQIAAPIGQIFYGFAFETFADGVWLVVGFAAVMISGTAVLAKFLLLRLEKH